MPLPPLPTANQHSSPGPAPPAPSSEAPSPGTTTTAQDPSPYQVNKPPQPTPTAKKPGRLVAAPATNPAPSAPAPAAAPALPPKLGDILTPEERKQYSASIDRSLSHAQASLDAIAGRQLNKDRQTEVEQIRNFMQQAQATRSSDLSGAKSLAERAEILARDLAATFR